SAPRLCLLPKEPEARKGRGIEDNISGSISGEAERPTLLSITTCRSFTVTGLYRARFAPRSAVSSISIIRQLIFIPILFRLLSSSSASITIYYIFSALYYTLINYSYTIRVIRVSTIITNINPKLQSYKYYYKRILVFIATGISVVAPLIYRLDIFGLDLINKKAFTCTIVVKIGCLLSGTALYTIRFPKSWWPGKFNIYSSYSFIYILVVCATIIQMIGYLEAFDYAYSNITCPAS
ncbi:unnamed protein product, partial [Clonostachys rosea f. rosea IK726]